jgi:hypothetical protein
MTRFWIGKPSPLEWSWGTGSDVVNVLGSECFVQCFGLC